MSEEIAYEEGERKVTPEIMDAEIQRMKQDSIRKLEKSQIDKQVRTEAGITEIPKEPESVPKELPQMAFKLASRAVKCEKMQLDEDEAKVFAKHLSIIIGSQNSKLYSVFIIIIIILGKIWSCWDAIGKILHRKPKDEIRKEERKPEKENVQTL